MTSQELVRLALAHHQAGRWDEAENIYRQVLATDARHADAWHLLGALSLQRSEPALALERFEHAIELEPRHADYLNNRALALRALNRLAEAAASHREALALKPRDAGMHYQLGHVLQSLDQQDEAQRCYERAIELQPDFADAHNNLGNVLATKNLFEQAAASFERAIQLAPERTQARFNLAGLLQSQGRNELAIAQYQELLKIDPRHLQTLQNLGAALQEQGRFDEARSYYRRTLALDPSFAEVWSNLGTLEQKQGEQTAALECYRRALQLNPASADAFSNLLLCSAHDPDISPQRLFELHRDWGLRHAKLVPPPRYANSLNADRPLRVGYVSADFVRHPVMRFFVSLVEHHNPQAVQTFHYSQVRHPDHITATLRRVSKGWRSILHFSDQQVFDLIQADEIDILVDLSGHTAGNRLRLFALRPAPIAVTYLGYPTTTGVPAIDYRLTDSVIDPPEGVAHSVESLWRLPGCFTALAPLTNVPDVGPLPVNCTRVFTFGSFHKVLKLNRDVIDAWCRILKAVPDSRLLLLRDTLVGEVRDRLVQSFTQRGIEPSRLDVRNTTGPGGHLAVYQEVDISLDTFPWSGHTTACESLWMGVPMLALCSEHHAGRMVASVLTCLGMGDWVAASVDEYVNLAIAKASRVDELTHLRTALRQHMRSSPLCDGKSFTLRVEQAYREMWRRYLAARFGR